MKIEPTLHITKKIIISSNDMDIFFINILYSLFMIRYFLLFLHNLDKLK